MLVRIKTAALRGERDKKESKGIYYISSSTCTEVDGADQSCFDGEAAVAVGEMPPSLNTWFIMLESSLNARQEWG